MLQLPDFVVIGLRALAFVALMQAAGAAMFSSVFGHRLSETTIPLRRLAGAGAVVAVVLIVVQHVFEPARMLASFSGIFDLSLQSLLLTSDAGAARSVRVAGLVLIAWASLRKSEWHEPVGLVGAVLALGSFALMGHTATHEARWILAVLLLAHLLIAAFWFGALLPFWLASHREPAAAFAGMLEEFSRQAIRLVPVILLAGLAMAYLLAPDLSSLVSPYGALLLAKLVAFAALMGLAALNKWRLAPAIARGEETAVSGLRLSITAEWLLIASVLSVTAVMTGLFSPGD